MDDLDFSIDPNIANPSVPQESRENESPTNAARLDYAEPSNDKYAQMSDQLHGREQQAKERLKKQAVI